jgi:hypothetical protein
MIPLSIVAKAAEQLRQEAVRNRRLSPRKRVEMYLAAQTLLPRYVGKMLVERALKQDVTP